MTVHNEIEFAPTTNSTSLLGILIVGFGFIAPAVFIAQAFGVTGEYGDWRGIIVASGAGFLTALGGGVAVWVLAFTAKHEYHHRQRAVWLIASAVPVFILGIFLSCVATFAFVSQVTTYASVAAWLLKLFVLFTVPAYGTY